ncbi:uncharacterized protein PV09_03066 [Verruconis gallopava]|uniref:Uncharacterized protein n=1 Tax=Verruconis gallopava TaxID=253628 RepID=A0A0D2AH21_9PEZI|nr:uncharacterized protein PV09_03066 [Verruconis gallopava]KIW05865.1 hypothetical protein PV09_03066 [Verruconis gallopava]
MAENIDLRSAHATLMRCNSLCFSALADAPIQRMSDGTRTIVMISITMNRFNVSLHTACGVLGNKPPPNAVDKNGQQESITGRMRRCTFTEVLHVWRHVSIDMGYSRYAFSMNVH